jgi:hypothetical protein
MIQNIHLILDLFVFLLFIGCDWGGDNNEVVSISTNNTEDISQYFTVNEENINTKNELLRVILTNSNDTNFEIISG